MIIFLSFSVASFKEVTPSFNCNLDLDNLILKNIYAAIPPSTVPDKATDTPIGTL